MTNARIIDSIRYSGLPMPGIDAMHASTARAFPRHTHDQYGIGLIDAGGHGSWSGRGQVEAGPGSFISVNPGEVHDGHAVGGAARTWRILYFETRALAALHDEAREGAVGEFTFEAPVFADPGLRSSFETAFSFAGTVGSADARVACEIAMLLLVARLGDHATRRSRVTQAIPSVRRARERIDADPALPLALAELAREARVSRYQLIRGFARETGLTPHAYIVQRRLALARRLIRTGRELAEVALLAGFCDQSHLARCFTRQFGVPPRRYAISS